MTVSEYGKCVTRGECSDYQLNGYEWIGQAYRESNYCNWGNPVRGTHPLNCVDWSQASAYCAWIGGRLPTESEWEYAAKSSGKPIIYPWGNTKPDCSRAVTKDEGGSGCGKDRTWAVCEKRAGNTQRGLCDMAGNVWEWTSSRYSSGQSNRVLRGGSFNPNEGSLRSSDRYGLMPKYRSYLGGFRCAQ